MFVAGRSISVLICYEDTLPAFVNRAVNHARPEMIVNLTNDGWFGDTTAPWIHLALAKLRAVEHRRYLLRSTNSVVEGNMFQQQTLDAEVRWMTGPRTGYEILGDAPWWVASGLILCLVFYSKPRHRRPTSEVRT
jgi:apolipoprotein N-acyltransferase